MTSAILKRGAIFFTALTAYTLVQYFRSDEADFLEYVASSSVSLFILIIGGSGWIAAGSYSSQAWDGMKSAFPDIFEQVEPPKHFAVGEFRTSDTLIAAIAPVVTSALDDGLIIAQYKMEMKPEHFVCIPWDRVEQIWVAEPKGLAKCKTAKDCGQLADRLKAEITIKRGNYPSIKIQIPWHDMFGVKLPPNIDLRKTWKWPYALHSVI